MHDAWFIWAPTVITLISVVYAAGAIVGRIKDQEVTVAAHNEWLKSHDVRLGSHDVAIAEGKAWRAGYDAGKSMHGRQV